MSTVEVFEVPDKSENDKKSYRVIRLINGLKVLLISTSTQSIPTEQLINSTNVEDENESDNKLAACSLCVDVGSFSNPRDIQGLAHFLEHMVLMGSEKYPGVNEFEQFMQKSGGFINADTDYEETSFYFRIQEEFLDEGMDRFSQFFKAPLILKESMTREREAIESEFSLKKNGENVRRGHLLASIGQPSHPVTTFACGNLKTLKENIEDDALNQKVHEFRRRHYSAHRMYVCVQSKQPLDRLQEMAARHFSTVPSNNLPGDDFSAYTHLNAFQSKFYEKVFIVKPISNISKIEITWCMEPTVQKYKSKPDYYLSHILGYEGKGSLISYFRKKLWAVDIIAGTDDSGLGSTSLFSLFKISIHLTADGFNHLDDILEALFAYLKLLKSTEPKEYTFGELQTDAANSFRFSHEKSAFANVQNLVLSLKQYPSKHILSSENLLFEYDAVAIQKIIDVLNERKFNIMITSKQRLNENINYELSEQWFGTQYSEIDMPDKWISLWENPKIFAEFTWPEPNPFITDDFTIFYNKGNVLPKYPTKILDNDLCELWFRQDDKFLLPTARYNFYFRTPLFKTSIKNMISTTLLSRLLQYQFVERLYPARTAGIKFSCSLADMGLVFQVEGFNQKLHLVVDVFSKCLKSLADDITESQFNVFVQQLFKSHENIFLQPKLLSAHLCLNIIQSLHQPLFEKNKHLRSIKFGEFREFCRNFCTEMHIKALTQGNITEDHALNIMHNILNDLNIRKIENLPTNEVSALKLPIGANYLRCRNFNLIDVNTSIKNYYQIGPVSYRVQALSQLLSVVAQEPIFNTLRTVEQLAYDVSFHWHKTHGTLGYSITVNSQETKFSADHVDERIEHFRRELMTIIEQMSNKDFDAFKLTLIRSKMSKDNRLNEEVQRNWDEIQTGQYEFDKLQKEVQCLSTITKDHLLEFYRTIYGENERKLSVQVIGNAQVTNSIEMDSTQNMDFETPQQRFDSLLYVNINGEPKGNLITDFIKFRNSLEVYPFIKIN